MVAITARGLRTGRTFEHQGCKPPGAPGIVAALSAAGVNRNGQGRLAGTTWAEVTQSFASSIVKG